jgi:3-deoxy-7-phosphoheptulonate synthase
MIIPQKGHLTPEQLAEVQAIVSEFNCTIRPIQGEEMSVYAIIGDETSQLLVNRIEGLPYVKRVDRIQVPYKVLAKENVHGQAKMIIGGKELGKDFVIIAGHCAIDPKNANLFYETAQAVKEAGADALRGGVWKPRTSPYSYQGDAKALEILVEARARTGMQIVTEVMEYDEVKLCIDAKVDVLQIGARNALNYRLLTQIGAMTAGTGIQVLLKRSIHMGPVDEFILAAEYIAGAGNSNVMLCPRGTLPTMNGYRNHPDESITQLLKERTWAPVVVDPSHSVGKAKYVSRAALAAASYGADGVIIETHCRPVQGTGDDPKQAITPAVLAKLIPELRTVSEIARKFEF